MRLPLLIKGFFSNPSGSNQTLAPAAPTLVQWTNQLPEGRGDMIGIDGIQLDGYYAATANAPVPLQLLIGSIQVWQNLQTLQFCVASYPGHYRIMALRQPAGQSLSFTLNQDQVGVLGPFIVHAYFENDHATPELLNALNYAQLKQRISCNFFGGFATGAGYGVNRQRFIVPKGRGNVVGIQPIFYNGGGAYGYAAADVFASGVMRFSVNGINVIEDASIYIGNQSLTRHQIWPIFIPGGQSCEFDVDLSLAAAGSSTFAGMILYFDECTNGQNPYGL